MVSGMALLYPASCVPDSFRELHRAHPLAREAQAG
jgi:hypothetical protein